MTAPTLTYDQAGESMSTPIFTDNFYLGNDIAMHLNSEVLRNIVHAVDTSVTYEELSLKYGVHKDKIEEIKKTVAGNCLKVRISSTHHMMLPVHTNEEASMAADVNTIWEHTALEAETLERFTTELLKVLKVPQASTAKKAETKSSKTEQGNSHQKGIMSFWTDIGWIDTLSEEQLAWAKKSTGSVEFKKVGDNTYQIWWKKSTYMKAANQYNKIVRAWASAAESSGFKTMFRSGRLEITMS